MGKGKVMCTIKPASRSKHLQVLPVIWMRLCDTEITQIADAVCSSWMACGSWWNGPGCSAHPFLSVLYIFLSDCLPPATVVITLFFLVLEDHDTCGSCYRLYAPFSVLFILLGFFRLGFIYFFALSPVVLFLVLKVFSSASCSFFLVLNHSSIKIFPFMRWSWVKCFGQFHAWLLSVLGFWFGTFSIKFIWSADGFVLASLYGFSTKII